MLKTMFRKKRKSNIDTVNPVLFAEKVTGKPLLPFQKKLVEIHFSQNNSVTPFKLKGRNQK